MDPIDTQSLMPWAETADYRSVRSSGYFTVPAVSVGAYPVTTKEAAASAGVYVAGDMVFTVATTALVEGGVEFDAKPADVVSYRGQDWTVLDASPSRWMKFHKVTARNLTLVYGLRDTVSLLRPDNAVGTGGIRTPSYSAVVTGVAARIQEQEPEVADHFGKRSAAKRYTCTVGQRLSPEATDRVTDQNGTTYTVKAWRSMDRLDLLMELDLERIG